MNNYVIDVNGRRYLVLDVATKMSALNKIGDKINEGDVVNITVQSTNTDVFCLDGDDINTESHPDEDEKKLTEETKTPPPEQPPQTPPPPQMEIPLWKQNTAVNMTKPMERSQMPSFQNVRSEPVGYYNNPTPTWEPLQQQYYFTTPNVGNVLRDKLKQQNVTLPNNDDINAWWCKRIIRFMTEIDGFQTKHSSDQLIIVKDEHSVTASINGGIILLAGIMPVECKLTLHKDGCSCEVSIENDTFLMIDIDTKQMCYEEISYPEMLTNKGIMNTYANYLTKVGLEIDKTFRQKR